MFKGIQFVNPIVSSLFGYSSQQLMEMNISELISDEMRSQLSDYIEQSITHDDTHLHIAQEFNALKADGSHVSIELNLTMMERQQDKILVGIIRDISQQVINKKQLEKAIQQEKSANQAKSAFLANMSHEIRTPMNAIIGLSELCLNTKLDKRQFDYVSKVNDAGQSLLRIINDILDFSKIETQKLDIEHEPFALEKILNNLSTILQVKAEEKNIDLLIYRSLNLPEHFDGEQ